ncbi:hypothetical protein GGS23DRAFT_561451 [Durotheca rogersii]|uniref:uncharacterized protein n=1 Tax=Durotheca rogersii TaxID=419775 RepID=UPI00221F4F21|nr:uncharacterized protein GGS23DRAFT_561451 [Durotheca rogersii]KAI5864700.1 hypothetical protein GGS23DRAFT_561451 [Durotheca rogersii]
MSTTPRSLSPLKHGVAADQSMMVELPTHLGDQDEFDNSIEEETVRLNPQQLQPHSTPPHQGARHDQSQEVTVVRNPERQRQTRTPEPQKRRSNRSDVQSPGHLATFDWDDFQYRYEKALQEADEVEKQLLEEFEHLIKYFNAWASASATHDNERAVKRLQTRERHVRLSEQTLLQKKQHLSEVVKAFQSALALLSAT